jgi:hypothetical protein
MKIISYPDHIDALIGFDAWVEWHKGSHTANCYNEDGLIFDCFTFAWEKNHPNMLDFTTALQSWMEYFDEAA